MPLFCTRLDRDVAPGYCATCATDADCPDEHLLEIAAIHTTREDTVTPITVYTTIDKLDEMSEDAQQLVGLTAVLGCADTNRVSEEELENAMWLLRKLARKVCADVCAMGMSDTRQNVRAI